MKTERDNGQHTRPQEHREFARLRRKIFADREKGIAPTEEQIDRLRELDDWLATHTDYWKRHYEKSKEN